MDSLKHPGGHATHSARTDALKQSLTKLLPTWSQKNSANSTKLLSLSVIRTAAVGCSQNKNNMTNSVLQGFSCPLSSWRFNISSFFKQLVWKYLKYNAFLVLLNKIELDTVVNVFMLAASAFRYKRASRMR